jgi:putative transposase
MRGRWLPSPPEKMRHLLSPGDYTIAMPRQARIVVPGVAHHIVQWGTNRQAVFQTQGDRKVYLELLRVNCKAAGVSLLSYCLMPNHIHLVAVPENTTALAVAMARTNGRYSQYFNARKLRSGHVWHNRFFSCQLARTHLLAAIAFVERNPVRAGLSERAEDFEWSSAAAHLSGQDPSRTLDLGFWQEAGGAEVWTGMLRQDEGEAFRFDLRRATTGGKSFGASELEAQLLKPMVMPKAKGRRRIAA